MKILYYSAIFLYLLFWFLLSSNHCLCLVYFRIGYQRLLYILIHPLCSIWKGVLTTYRLMFSIFKIYENLALFFFYFLVLTIFYFCFLQTILYVRNTAEVDTKGSYILIHQWCSICCCECINNNKFFHWFHCIFKAYLVFVYTHF